MKKVLLVIGFFLAMNFAKSQVIDTSVTFITACKIQAVKVKISDTTYSVKLGVKSLGDNLQTSATLYGCFLDANNRITSDFNYTLSGIEYTNYDGTANYLFKILDKIYSLVFVP